MSTSIFPTESARLHFANTSTNDFSEMLDVYNSNPFFTKVSMGSAVVTVKEVEQDHLETEEFENSYSLVIREKGKEPIIGVAQFILRNPRDNNPWLGLLIFHQEKQKYGYAREFLQVLTGWLQENGFNSLHLAVLEKNDVVVPFYVKCGFTQYEERETEKLGRVLCLSTTLG